MHPAHPVPLTTPKRTTHNESMHLTKEHGEDIRVFKETLEAYKATVKHIVLVIGKNCLKQLRNARVYTIINSIYLVLEHLVSAYGMVDSYILVRDEAKFKGLFCNLSDTPLKNYNSMGYLFDISEADNISKSPSQAINFVLDIIWKSIYFERALTNHFNRLTEEQNFIILKTHFTTVHCKLKRFRGPTLQNIPFHQANQITFQLTSEFKKRDMIY